MNWLTLINPDTDGRLRGRFRFAQSARKKQQFETPGTVQRALRANQKSGFAKCENCKHCATATVDQIMESQRENFDPVPIFSALARRWARPGSGFRNWEDATELANTKKTKKIDANGFPHSLYRDE